MLTGCGEAEQSQAVEIPTVKPAMIEVVSSSQNKQLTFNGVVQASERADLSFRVGGRLTNILVKEGDSVKKGQLLAELDGNDASIALASAVLERDNIEIEYKRAKSLYEKSRAISKSNLDDLTTKYNLAINRLHEAERQLAYTRIEAPFDGIIGRKLLDNHTQVQANAAVFTLHNLEDMEVVINIPDSVMLSGDKMTKAHAEITAAPDKLFNLSLETFATQADPASQTYAIVLGFDDLDGYRVLPGMTVKVFSAEHGSSESDTNVITLPVTAINPDNKGKQFIWVVGENNKVTQRFVTIGELSGDRVVITDNLAINEKVVIAGVSSLLEGMEVRPVEFKG
ncbi:efflux RND transporter periplasmic adaptor subunit [Vibrio splendidus]